jgi:hypothetical protein
MDSMAIVMLLADRAGARGALSALPDAPTVPYVEKVAAPVRLRGSLASWLHRVADLVSPSVHAVRA